MQRTKGAIFGFFPYSFSLQQQMSFVLSGHGVDFVAQFQFNMLLASFFLLFFCAPFLSSFIDYARPEKGREHIYVYIFLEEDSCEILYAAFVFECCAHLSAQWGNLFARLTHAHSETTLCRYSGTSCRMRVSRRSPASPQRKLSCALSNCFSFNRGLC